MKHKVQKQQANPAVFYGPQHVVERRLASSRGIRGRRGLSTNPAMGGLAAGKVITGTNDKSSDCGATELSSNRHSRQLAMRTNGTDIDVARITKTEMAPARNFAGGVCIGATGQASSEFSTGTKSLADGKS